MNILLIGKGGREHTLAWKISQSPHCKKLFAAPGNPGTAALGTNLEIREGDFDAITRAIEEQAIRMVVVGPEQPLVDGLYDHIRSLDKLREVMVIGPSQKAARLEGSKSYAKNFMQHYGIPTARFVKYAAWQTEDAMSYLDTCTPPIVLKADGLAAGKGVVICDSIEEAKKELGEMFEGKFGEASETVVIEKFMSGREFSVFAATDGTHYRLLPVAKDYKRVGEGDTGLNTGGMGAVSPVPFVDDTMMEKVEERIIKPTIHGIQNNGHPYTGFLFFGLIEVGGDPYVIEYNCRLGDPETEVVLPLLECDLVELMMHTAAGTLDTFECGISDGAAATVMAVSGGYPQKYPKGLPISGVESVKDSLVFHAGTKRDARGTLVTNGGRVLAVTSVRNTIREALRVSYDGLDKINFDGQYYRKDIGYDLNLD